MRIYMRLAGIVEMGATEGLKFNNEEEKIFDPAAHFQNSDYRKASDLDNFEKTQSESKKASNLVNHSKVIDFESLRKLKKAK